MKRKPQHAELIEAALQGFQRTTTDARNLETATLIYEQHIAPNLPTA
jgi:hypothetical protein